MVLVASDGWLDKQQKATYTIKKRRILGEGGDVSEETVSLLIERMQELTGGCLLENIWNMDESGCFLKPFLIHIQDPEMFTILSI